MKLPFATAGLAAALLALPAGAAAGTISVSPQKPCYRSGEPVTFSGTRFSPNGPTLLTSGNSLLDSFAADGQGAFTRSLPLNRTAGQGATPYTAIDAVGATTSSPVSLLVSAVTVTVAPRAGRLNRRLLINARGFTTGRQLYAHVRGGRARRNVRVGRLRGACATLRVRKRLLRAGIRRGRYTVQFDTFARYSARRAVKVLYTVAVAPTRRR